MNKTVNQGQEKGRAEARKSGRVEKTICENPCNLWTYVFFRALLILRRQLK